MSKTIVIPKQKYLYHASGCGGGGEHIIKDLKRKANSLSRDTRQANALGLEGGSPPLRAFAGVTV